MNKESIEIIKNTVKPDSSLIEKTKAVAMSKNRTKTHIPALIAACLLVILCASFAVTKIQSGDFKGTVPVNETTAEERELLYSELVPFKLPTREEYNVALSMDIAAFNEASLKDCTAVIEGEILSVREKEYTVIYEFDKFEEKGLLTDKPKTVIYEIKTERVWCGDINEGDILTVENEAFLFACGGIVGLDVGRKYVLPLCDEGEDIRTDEAGQRYLSGDTKRESPYSILYPFHPQIEKTDRGYLFTSDWESLVTKETMDVTVDISLADEEQYYADKMKLNSEEVFREQFTDILKKVGLIP